MNFDSASLIDQIAYSCRLADRGRALNRARIDSLFNGAAPFTQQEVQENNIAVNVNDLSSTRLAHDGRSQYFSAFLKPGNYFTARTDSGPVHKRTKWSSIVTKEMNRIMKRDLCFFEMFRSKFALLVLHGVGPSAFRDSDHWCPDPLGMCDVHVPANTLLTMRNLPFFLIYRSFTAQELIKLAKGPKADPAWNQKLVDSCLKWVDTETMALMGNNWPETWSPEKLEERIKGDGGFYTSDNVPTINVWDFYFWNDENDVCGWNRRMILDAWSTPGSDGTMGRKSGEPYESRDQFLYNPGKRKWADQRSEIINWQFADLSSVAPFRYHTIRSLGFLLYSVCHLQNRLRCKFNEAVFEQLMVLMRVKSADDMQRALSVNLFNRGFVDDSIDFIKAGDRYQVNTNLAELGLRENQNLIASNSSSYTTNQSRGDANLKEKTKFEVQAEVAAMTSLVSAGLLQAYQYQVPEYREIFRRFCKKSSIDPDVRTFQANVLKQGVPEKVLNAEQWELEPERVMGAGNKSMEMAIAQQLMQYRNLYDPEPQRHILRDVTLAITDDPARADSLVPEVPQVSNTIHDTELVFAALMQGTQVTPKSGVNNIEVIGVILKLMQDKIGQIMQSGGVGTPQDVQGLSLCQQYVTGYIQKLSEDPNEKAKVTMAGKQLGKLMNEVKGMAQRQQEMAQKAAQSNGQDAETQAKIKAMLITAEAKAKNTVTSHAQRTAQRQVQFEQEQQQKRIEFESELQQGSGEAQAQHEMQIAQAEHQQGMTIEAHRAALDMASKKHDMAIKRMQSEHDMRLKQKEADHKQELATQMAEHQKKLASKQAKAKPAK